MEFLITPLSGPPPELWFVFRHHVAPANCVAVCGSEVEACERAIGMAQYHVSAGGAAQVHVRRDSQNDWRTVWCSPGAEARFPPHDV